jgi:hypothetical protein
MRSLSADGPANGLVMFRFEKCSSSSVKSSGPSCTPVDRLKNPGGEAESVNAFVSLSKPLKK